MPLFDVAMIVNGNTGVRCRENPPSVSFLCHVVYPASVSLVHRCGKPTGGNEKSVTWKENESVILFSCRLV